MAKVLIVDDHPSMRQALCRQFQAHGHLTLSAASGEEAVKVGRRQKPDAAVIDLVLPAMDGYGVFATLKTEHPDLLGVAISGVLAKDEAEERCLSAGFAVFASKHSDLSGVVEIIDRRLGPERFATNRSCSLGGTPDYCSASACLRNAITEFRLLNHGLATGRIIDMSHLSTQSMRILASLLVHPRLSLWLFLAVSTGLRSISNGLTGNVATVLQGVGSRLEGAVTMDRSQLDRRLLLAIAGIENIGSDWLRFRPSSLAAECGLTTRKLGYLFGRHLSQTVLEVRRAVIIRRAVMGLATTGEHVDQIAYQLGYAHASAMDRDMKLCLGIAPKTFRTLVGGGSVKQPWCSRLA